MSSIALATGLKALISAQFVLDTVGHNIANANTVGYSRQRVMLDAAFPLRVRGLLVGSGVDASSVQRSVDELLNRRILTQRSVAGGLESQLGGLTEIEALFNEPDENSLGGRLDGFFSSVSALSAASEDSILRTGLVQAGVSLATQLNHLASSLGNMTGDLRAEVEAKVEQVNQLAAEIADLNVQIGETEAAGLPANDLSDQRDRALSELSRLVEVKTVEDARGAVNVLVAGNTLVSSARANRMTVSAITDNDLALQVEGATGFLDMQGGSIGGLIRLAKTYGPSLRTELDRLAKNLVLEVNRVHSTGIPAGGPFTALTGENAVEDQDGDGRLRDELVANAGLPFDVASGRFYVNVTDLDTGEVEKHAIDVRSTHTTVGGILDALNDIPSLSADLDASGRFRLVAGAGYGFDFSRRIDPNPDPAGTFGGGRASLGTATAGPYALADGDTLQIVADPGGAAVPVTITFASGDFAEISEATAEEIAAAINADAGAQANGIAATTMGGALYLQTAGTGATAEFQLAGGTAAGALGWDSFVGTTISGHDNAVDVEIGGVYTGDSGDVYTFRPRTDGTIGTTEGLLVDVLDATGQRIATLDVGAGYEPGAELTVAEGVTVKFGLGELSATNYDQFALELVADSDTTDFLVAAGINALFVGSTAENIAVRADIEADPQQIAASMTGFAGDNTLLLALLDVEESQVTGLDNASLGQFYGDLAGGVGFQVATAANALEANEGLINSLEMRRDQISGVSVDEEMVDLLRYEQAFAAAAQYITVVNQLGDELLSLI
ncbi:MAG: flagellar hook-associated protein FlgK [Planctomycetota bacterium]